ncbi:MAG: acetylglutamate kinase [Alphaproteobacteria bacterium]|nr:acetylglutamate kinase [Alphaproteobacteria bacterium]
MTNQAPPDHGRLMETARTLAEALPYMRQFNKNTFVVKFGGHAMGDDSLGRSFAEDIVLLKQVGINPVVVHGGGPQIGKMLERLNIKSNFVDGLRITDAATVEVVEMVLAGTINKQLVASINAAGGTAVGLSGKDGRLIEATRLKRTARDPDSNIEKVLDLGFVGEPTKVNPHVLRVLEQSDIIPVIAPTGVGLDGNTYNINADTAAGAIAGALQASKLLMMTDVPGVLDKQKKLLNRLSPEQCERLLADGTISGGMIPKLETCLQAVRQGAKAAHILDGRLEHVLLLEVFTEHGVGTMITRD